MNKKKITGLIALFICLQVLFAVNSFAYLDPSAMTYVIQAVAGVVIAGGAAVIIYWRKIKLFFKKKKSKKLKAKSKEEETKV